MNIDDLTIKQVKEISSLCFGAQEKHKHEFIGSIVIVRTYSAGVWFGELSEKSGTEVVLKNARRMWRWWAAESISLSACAIHGIKRDKSKICIPVPLVWLEAIEIIPCLQTAIDSIGGAENAKAE